MQLKKTTREDRFTGTNERFEEDVTPEFDSSFEMPAAVEAPPRQPRSRTPESELEATPARQATAPRQESLVDAHSNFDGRYETQHDLRVQGSISGEVVCRGLLTIEQEATARARIQSRDAHIHGRLDGDIVCTGKLILAATANVSGTIKAATLVVEEGATLSGSVETAATAAPLAQIPAPTVITRAPVASLQEERDERGQAPEPVAAAPIRSGRQAPNFAFVPSDERRPDRN
jgi:cytoskeletal protein CcmA (bactofilin family)